MNDNLNLPIWQLTVEELSELISDVIEKKSQTREVEPGKKYVHGIRGIAELFGCSLSTAKMIKKSGIIDDAISQVNRKIVVDADHALKLLKKKGGRNER